MPLIGTNNPGEFVIPELDKTIRLVEWEEKDIYDTVALPSGTQLTGNSISFFTNQAQKSYQDSNVRTNSKLPARHELICFKVGVFVKPVWGNAAVGLYDQISIYSEGAYVLNKNAKPQITNTHMWRMATGYGYVAYGLNAALTDVAPGNLGVASPAAIPPLLVPFVISHEDDFDAILDFPISNAGVANAAGAPAPTYVSQTTANDLAVMNVLHGFVRSPGSR